MNDNSVFRYTALLVLVSGFVLILPVTGQEEANKTKAGVDAAIKAAGSTMPDWWESVELEYPETLDLSWPVRQGSFGGGPGRGGQPSEQASTMKVDDYLFGVVYSNPSKYKQGIKLVNHLMILHKDDKEKLQRSLTTLGDMFYQLLGDYARAAFWWQKSAQMGGTVDPMKMAYCYFELGSKTAAEELLSQIDDDAARNNKDLVKMWAQIGEVDKALSMIESNFTDGRGGLSGNDKLLFSAEICRGAGQYDEAIAHYENILASSDSGMQPRGRGRNNAQTRATNNLAVTKLLKDLDISKVPDGSYTAESQGFGGPMTVKVESKDGRIVSVEVVRNTETQSYFSRARATAGKIVANQGFKGVHGITGATISSDAIVNASAAALSEAVD